ncbi:hypothetical protein J6G99_03100 [bacterium]|nr:hypothetical protein [bacterium]
MILSDVIELKKTNNLDEIEKFLNQRFHTVLRWAIIDVEEKTMKISVTYKS